jgi:hypothetical protein
VAGSSIEGIDGRLAPQKKEKEKRRKGEKGKRRRGEGDSEPGLLFSFSPLPLFQLANCYAVVIESPKGEQRCI